MPVSPGAVTERAYPLLLGSLAVAVFLAVTAVAMLGPLLVDMAAALGTTVPVAAQVVTAASAVWAATALAAGPFSDAYGRKPVIVLGLCSLAAGALGVGLAPTFAAAVGFSLLVGIGGGMVPPTCISLVGDLIASRRQPMSIALLTMQPGMSVLLGVPLAAVLGEYAGWRSPFLAVGLALLLAALLLFLLVPRRKPSAGRAALVGRMRRVAAFPVTWYIAGTNILARTAWGAVITLLPPFLIVTYGMRKVETALPMAVVALWMTAAPLLGGRIGRLRKRLAVTAGLLLMAAIPGLGVFLPGWSAWSSVLAAGLLMLLVVPVTTVLVILIAETGGGSRGTFAGVISSSNWGGMAAGAAIGGVLVDHVGYGALSFLLAGAVLGSGLLMAFAVNERAMVRLRDRFSPPPEGE
ncbi:MAG: MFS transporter [Alphaproteobacteria bacterium]|nr:MFS transporter [Alphaproteobacteria bacterium]